ncbi:MAG: hypothetical protein AMXMBFR51_21100 [Ignavibacteriota bacterium]
MIVIWFILFLIIALFLNAIAGRFSAMQDAVKHYPNSSIFVLTATSKPKRFGILSDYWYNLNGKDWLAKYEDYDSSKPLRKFKILFLNIHLVQLTDAWHWFKMWNLCFERLTDLFYAASVVILFNYLYSNNFNSIITIVISYAVIYFILSSIFWIVSFNLHYDNLLKLK